jgi:hypothetical protein
MTQAKKILLLLAALLYLAGMAADLSLVPAIGGKLDGVIVIYESNNQPVAEASAMNGPFSRELRKAGKWKSYDDDQLPASLASVVQPFLKNPGIPCLIFVRGGKLAKATKYPASDADLKTTIESNGGI